MADPFGILVGRNIGGFSPGPSLADILTREAQSQGRPAPAFPTPPPEPQSALARAMKDHAGYMERGGLFGTLSGMAPPGLRRALEPWGGMLNPLEWTPGPSIQQMLQSSGDLTRATLAGQPIGMLNALAGVTMGAIGAVPGGRAVTRSAKATADLAMDLASRQSRAEKMFPVEVYHGTAYDFDAFDPRKYGQTMPGPVSGLGVSVSTDPRVASHFAEMAAKRQEELREQAIALGEKPPPAGVGPSVMPLRLDPRKQGNFRLPDQHSSGQVAAAIMDAWDAGFDSVRLTNYREVPGIGPPR
ncbi:hypothetical protein [Vineibacter terrae]|uniref:hypothetical protein n=1 Tax=Vineibacter terrae TaxID=2586908 RepID=UPI002E30CB47|nr:hypothetical protein [Vineibacter terrae]HEX2888088.1 hypothetical protein [Vineibacter terrae]